MTPISGLTVPDKLAPGIALMLTRLRYDATKRLHAQAAKVSVYLVRLHRGAPLQRRSRQSPRNGLAPQTETDC